MPTLFSSPLEVCSRTDSHHRCGLLCREVFDTHPSFFYVTHVKLRGKKLGILLSRRPEIPSFHHGVRLAEAALQEGVTVYLYCIDDAVWGLDDLNLQSLRAQGLNLYACAYGARRRGIPVRDQAVFAGLSVVSDLIAATDRFVSFN